MRLTEIRNLKTAKYLSLLYLPLSLSLFCLDNFFNLFNIPTHFQFTHGALTQHFLFIASGVKSNFLFSGGD